MNNVSLCGRLIQDPDVRTTPSNSVFARFTLAVDRRFKKDGDTQTADFINCVAFGKQAEFVEKYFKKGMKMDLTGRIQTGSYTNKEGHKISTVDVVADSVEFGESKGGAKGNSQPKQQAKPNDGFMDIADEIDSELPFN